MSNFRIFRYIAIFCLFASTSARLMSIEVLEVEILDADARRVKRLRIHKLPNQKLHSFEQE